MAASVLGIHREFDYVNREIDDIHFQYNTLFLYYVFLHFFSLLVLLKLLKHVILKQIIFKNHNKCKTKHLFLIKNVVTRFDKKNGDMAEKEH